MGAGAAGVGGGEGEGGGGGGRAAVPQLLPVTKGRERPKSASATKTTAPSPIAAGGLVAVQSTGALPPALVDVGGVGTKRFILTVPQELQEARREVESSASRRPVLLETQQAPLLPKVSWNVFLTRLHPRFRRSQCSPRHVFGRLKVNSESTNVDFVSLRDPKVTLYIKSGVPKVQERELAKSGANRQTVGMPNPLRGNNDGTCRVREEGMKPKPVTAACPKG